MIRYTQAENGAGDEQSGGGRGTLDVVLGIGASFDWITPALALIGQATGKLVGMSCPRESWGYVYATLRGGGVKVSNAQIIGVKMLFTVPTKQAKRAVQLLR